MKEEKTTEPLQHMVSERSSSSVLLFFLIMSESRVPTQRGRGAVESCQALQWALTLEAAEDPKKLTSANQHGIFLLLSEYVTSYVLTPYCFHLHIQH